MQEKDKRPQRNLVEDLFEEYADLHIELEGTLQSFELLSADIEFAMDDIRDELERLQDQLKKCSKNLRRVYRTEELDEQPFEV